MTIIKTCINKRYFNRQGHVYYVYIHSAVFFPQNNDLNMKQYSVNRYTIRPERINSNKLNLPEGIITIETDQMATKSIIKYKTDFSIRIPNVYLRSTKTVHSSNCNMHS